MKSDQLCFIFVFLKIVDLETDKTLPSDQLGELWVKGPQVMLGYYKNQAATDDMITQDKWLRTGELGCVCLKTCKGFYHDYIMHFVSH